MRGMFGLGMGEWLIILVIVLVVFGAGKLPAVGEALGKTVKNFKRASKGEDEIDVTPKSELKSGNAGNLAAKANAAAVEDAEVVSGSSKS